MKKWEYQNLDNDIEELTENLMSLNQQSMEKASKTLKNLKLDKSEKKLRKTVVNLFRK